MVGQTRATHLCAHEHSEGGNLSVAVEWLPVASGRVLHGQLLELPCDSAAIRRSRYVSVATCHPAETVTGNRLASRRRLRRMFWNVFLGRVRWVPLVLPDNPLAGGANCRPAVQR